MRRSSLGSDDWPRLMLNRFQVHGLITWSSLDGARETLKSCMGGLLVGTGKAKPQPEGDPSRNGDEPIKARSSRPPRPVAHKECAQAGRQAGSAAKNQCP